MTECVLWPIEAKWRIYASVNIDVADNGMLSVQHHALIWTTADVMLMRPVAHFTNMV